MIYERFADTARANTDRPAVIDDEVSVSYGALLARADAIAAALWQHAGAREGHLILAPLPNSADFIALLFAAARIGAVLMPVDPSLKNRELASYVERFAIRAAVTPQALRDARPDAFGPLPADRWFTIEALAAAPAAEPTPRTGGPFEGVLIAVSTSGSTGTPKVAGRTHRSMAAGFDALDGAIGHRTGDIVLGVTPVHHSHALSNAIMYSMLGGRTLVVMRRFLPRRLIDIVAAHHVSLVVGSPFIFGTVADCISDPAACASLRFALSSGEAVPEPAARAFREKSGVAICELYGSTETGVMALDGRVVTGVDIRVVDEHAAPVPPGEIGELLVRTPIMAAGYLGDDGNWAFALRDGYYPTGDLGRFDADGRLLLGGRLLRRLNIAGVKVDPLEIERVIQALPGVARAEVSGVPGERGLAVIRARVMVRPGTSITREAVIGHCRPLLAEHKVPRIVEVVDDLGVNVMGKRVPGA